MGGDKYEQEIEITDTMHLDGEDINDYYVSKALFTAKNMDDIAFRGGQCTIGHKIRVIHRLDTLLSK